MDSPKKRTLHYTDLTLVQLKTFADRGDLRAKKEIERRLGTPGQASTPGAPLGATPQVTARRPQPATSSSTQKTASQNNREQGHTANKNSTHQTTASPPLPPAAAAAILQADALLGLKPGKSTKPDLSHLLINDAPGADPAASASMSPRLIAKLEEIARNAPDDDDDEQPPVFLGGSLMALGVIVTLFGFGLTRGPHGTWSFVACGLAMAISGFFYFKGKKLALLLYALTCVMAVAWGIYEASTWLESLLRMATPLLIACYAFLPRVRERLG